MTSAIPPTSPDEARPSKGSKPRGARPGSAKAPTGSIAPPRSPPARIASSASTPRRRPHPAACTSATSSATPTWTSRRGSSACAASTSSTRWAGTTTACRPSVACRTTTACAATRRSPTSTASCRRSRAATGTPAKAADQVPISRRNFIELCETLTAEDEKQFEELWRTLGLSVDWSLTYRTIGDEAQLAAQRAFLRNLGPRRGLPGRRPDPVGRHLPHRGRPGRARRQGPAGRLPPGDASTAPTAAPIEIETTRPELLPACVALVAHPDDERYQALFGTTVTTPLFGVEVPVLAHHLAQKDKGSGIAMICTFGDVTDVVWWRELDLPNRAIIGIDGRILAEAPAADLFTDAGRAAYAELAGKTVFSAKARIVELLRESGDLHRRPEADHPPGEVLREGRQAARDRRRPASGTSPTAPATRRCATGCSRPARQIDFHPDFMRVRYENWVGGLTGDWLISRQRFFGVPIPVWYPLDADGEPIARAADRARRGPAAGRPVVGRRARLRRVAARRAGRLRRRARHHGHLGDLEPHPADRGRLGDRPRAVRPGVPVLAALAGPGHHPHLAVLDGAARRARARRDPVEARRHLGLHRRPRPQEDVEVEGQRRHPGGDARGARLGCGALLGGQSPPRHRRGVRPAEPEADQDRAPPRDQGAQRGEVRLLVPASRRPGAAVTEPLDLDMLAELARGRRDRDRAPTRSTTTPARSR